MALEFAYKRLRDDTDLVKIAVSTDGNALEHASDRLKNDREVVSIAINTNGSALRFASNDLRADKGIVFEAIKNNHHAASYASDNLKNEIGDDPARYVVAKEFQDKLQSELPKNDTTNDFRTIIDSKQIQELHASILEKNKSVEIPDTYITESKYSLKESELKSNVVSITEVKNDMTSETQLTNVAKGPQRRLKL